MGSTLKREIGNSTKLGMISSNHSLLLLPLHASDTPPESTVSGCPATGLEIPYTSIPPPELLNADTCLESSFLTSASLTPGNVRSSAFAPLNSTQSSSALGRLNTYCSSHSTASFMSSSKQTFSTDRNNWKPGGA